MASVRIRLVLGAPPSFNEVALSNGRTTFTGGAIDVNDMFQYVTLDSGVEILYGAGTALTSLCSCGVQHREIIIVLAIDRSSYYKCRKKSGTVREKIRLI